MFRMHLAAGLAAVGILAATPAAALTANGITFLAATPTITLTGLTGTGTALDPFVLSESITGLDDTIEIQGMASISEVGAFASGFFLTKVVTNNTAFAWSSYDNELQETLGVPSPDGDGLSFAQGNAAVRPFTSDLFASVFEESTVRDQVNFFNGVVPIGGTVTMSFAITDNSPTDPFYLRQRPNFIDPEQPNGVIPVPAALPLMASAAAGLALVARRRRRT